MHTCCTQGLRAAGRNKLVTDMRILLACAAALPRRAEAAADGAESHTSEGRGLPCLAEGSAGAAGW